MKIDSVQKQVFVAAMLKKLPTITQIKEQSFWTRSGKLGSLH